MQVSLELTEVLEVLDTDHGRNRLSVALQIAGSGYPDSSATTRCCGVRLFAKTRLGDAGRPGSFSLHVQHAGQLGQWYTGSPGDVSAR